MKFYGVGVKLDGFGNNPRDFCIRAIGFIMDTSIPENVPEDYKGKQGVTVEWTIVFSENLH